MSHKAFYQTFYQAETLFRLPDDALSFGLRTVALPEPEPVSAPVSTPDSTPINRLVALPEVRVPVAVVESVLVAPPMSASVIEPIVPGSAIEPSVPEPVRTAARPVPVLRHRVLIVVADAPLPGELLFLQNVLKAVQLDTDSVDLLTLPDWQGNDFGPVLADRQTDYFIVFGVSFVELGLDIEMDLYHPVRFHGITFMRADAPGLIEGDRPLKKRLWESLKRIFLPVRPQ